MASHASRVRLVLLAALAVAVVVTVLLTRGGGRDVSMLPTHAVRAAPGPAPEPAAATEREDLPREEAAPRRLEEALEFLPTASELVPAEDGLTIRVTDPDDTPIAGAEVRIAYNEDESDEVFHTAHTDADGVSILPVAERLVPHFSVRADAEGYHHAKDWWDYEGEGSEVEVTLHSSRTTLTGIVRDRIDGTPIAGAYVRRPHDCCEEEDEAETDADGRYRISGIPAGWEIDLTLSAEGYADQMRWFLLRGEETEFEVDLLLERGAPLRGRVLDWVTGEPVVGATVTNNSGVEELVTDATGSFEGYVLAAPNRSQVNLRVRSESHASLRLPCDLARDETLELRLPRLCPVAGVLRDEAGEPIEGAYVSVRRKRPRGRDVPTPPFPAPELPEGWRFDEARSRGRTDAKGEFRMPGILPWQTDQIVRAYANDTRVESEYLLPRPPGEEQWVELTATGRPEGSGSVAGFITLNGQPIEGMLQWSGAGLSGSGGFNDRFYRLEGLPEGPVALRVEPGYDEEEAAVLRNMVLGAEATVTVSAGEEARHDFALTVDTAPISGHVHDALGEPVAERMVSLSRESEPDYDAYAETDEEGAYAFEVPIDGTTYRVSPGYGTGIESRQGVHPGTEGVDFQLPRLGTLRVRMLDAATGEPSRYGTRIAARPVGVLGRFQALRGDVDHEGNYELEVEPGSIDVQLIGTDSYAPLFVHGVEVVADRTTELEVELRAGTDVAFTLDPEGLQDGVSFALLQDEVVGDGEVDPRLAHDWRSGTKRLYFREGKSSARALAEARYHVVPYRTRKELEWEPRFIDVGPGLEQPVVITVSEVEKAAGE